MSTAISTDCGRKKSEEDKTWTSMYVMHVDMSMIRQSEIPTTESPRELHSKIFPLTGPALFAA